MSKKDYESRDESKMYSGRYQKLLPTTIGQTSLLQFYVLAILREADESMTGKDLLDAIEERTALRDEQGQIVMVKSLAPSRGNEQLEQERPLAWQPSHGGMYNMLHDIAEQGWIREVAAPSETTVKPGPKGAVWYEITDEGRVILKERMSDVRDAMLAQLVTQMRVISEIYGDPDIIDEARRRTRIPTKD